MKEQIKAYCLEELKNIQRGWDADKAICRAYGAMMFYTNYAKDEPEEDRDEIRKWWDTDMMFRLVAEKYKQKRKRCEK